MENEFRVALLLWAPLGLVFLSIGLQFRKDPGVQKVGKVCGGVGLLLYGISFQTVPSSPSAASSALLVSILPSIALMFVGLYVALFSGDVPVRRFSPKMRPLGLLMFVFGFALLEAMHWNHGDWIPSTNWNGETNPFWMIFKPTFLLAMSSFLLAGGYLVNLIGQRISQTSRVLYLTGGTSFLLLLITVLVDGSKTISAEFHTSVLYAASDLLGFLAGVGLTIICFSLAIWQYERKRPALEKLSPPDSEQLAKAAGIIKKNLGGDDDE